MTSHVLSPSPFAFNACLHAPCISTYNNINFTNVQWAYFALDPLSARKLFLNDEQFYAKAQSMSNSSLKALVVDSSTSWGGFPQDLARNARKAGFDILVVQEYGDEEHNCGFGTQFSYENTCPLPIFRIASTVSKEILSQAETVTLQAASVWRSTQVNSLSCGIVKVVLSFFLLIITLNRLQGLGAPKVFNTGIAICYLTLVQLVLFMITAVWNLWSFSPREKFVGVMSTVMVKILLSSVSINSTYLIAREFQVALRNVKGEAASGWKDPKVMGVAGLIILINIVNLIAGVMVGTQVYGSGGAFSATFGIFFFARLAMAFYFVWGYRSIIKIMSSAEALKLKTNKSLVMGKRLMVVTAFILLSLIFSIGAAIPSIYYFNGMSILLLNILEIWATIVSLLEVTSLPLRRSLLAELWDMFVCQQKRKHSKISAHQRSSDHKRTLSNGQAVTNLQASDMSGGVVTEPAAHPMQPIKSNEQVPQEAEAI